MCQTTPQNKTKQKNFKLYLVSYTKLDQNRSLKPNAKSTTIKLLGEKTLDKTLWPWVEQNFLIDFKSMVHKRQNWSIGLQQS